MEDEFNVKEEESATRILWESALYGLPKKAREYIKQLTNPNPIASLLLTLIIIKMAKNKKAKPLKIELLKMVRKGIKMYPTIVCGVDMFVINVNISKTSLPSQTTVFKKEAGQELVRLYRLKAAKEVFNKKRFPDEEWDNEIKV